MDVTSRSLSSSLFQRSDEVKQEGTPLCQPVETPKTSQCRIELDPETTASANEACELAAVSGINPLFNRTALNEQKTEGILAFSAFDPKLCRKVACKARNTPKDHDYETAYFVIPHDAIHGLLLKCSHPKCNKMKFRYCSVCGVPVAKRNFPRRHGHGLLPQDTVLGDDEDIPAMVRPTPNEPLSSGASPASTPGQLLTTKKAAEPTEIRSAQRASKSSPLPKKQPEDDEVIPETTRCGFRIPVIVPLPEDRTMPAAPKDEPPMPMQVGISENGTSAGAATRTSSLAVPSQSQSSPRQNPDKTSSITDVATQSKKDGYKDGRSMQEQVGASFVEDRIPTGGSNGNVSNIPNGDAFSSIFPIKSCALPKSSASPTLVKEKDAFVDAFVAAATAATSPAASLLETLNGPQKAAFQGGTSGHSDTSTEVAEVPRSKGPKVNHVKLEEELLNNSSCFDEVELFEKQEIPLEMNLAHDDISVPDDASLHDVDVDMDDVFENTSRRSSKAGFPENGSASVIQSVSLQDCKAPLALPSATLEAEGLARKRKLAEFLAHSKAQPAQHSTHPGVSGDNERNSPPPGSAAKGDGEDDNVIIMPVTKRERRWIRLLHARPVPSAPDALKAWLAEVLKHSEPRERPTPPSTSSSN